MALARFRRSSPENQSPKDPTKRRIFSKWRLFYVFIYLAALVLLILVDIGNIGDKPVIRNTYFIKIDLSEIIPRSVPDAVLINSIARTIGLHDFYQVGLWNFCEGYDDGSGITYCSTPTKMYAFNPVEILLSELLAGATIALPGGVTDALDIARIASHWMFGLFIAGTVLTFICIFLTPFSISTTSSTATSSPPTGKRRTSHSARKRVLFPLTILAFLTFLITAAATILATAMFTIFKIVFTKNEADLNIHADLGTQMLAFMWTATGLTLIGFIFHLGRLCACCCRAGRRKVHGHGERQPAVVESEPKGVLSPSSLSRGMMNGGGAEEKPSDNTRRRLHGWKRMRVGS